MPPATPSALSSDRSPSVLDIVTVLGVIAVFLVLGLLGRAVGRL
ncbi:hypothetical protein [Brachybacterium hainanense]|uniref:Uncharacterized protein n=1 Tax=Brachybacterium hainanense TaxID=1541174 RepID=A0ABV6RD61_9MICO